MKRRPWTMLLVLLLASVTSIGQTAPVAAPQADSQPMVDASAPAGGLKVDQLRRDALGQLLSGDVQTGVNTLQQVIRLAPDDASASIRRVPTA